MEAIIKTENKTLFDALLQFLKTLNITVETKEYPTGKSLAKHNKKEREFGCMKGLVVYMSDDFNEPLDDFKEYMPE